MTRFFRLLCMMTLAAAPLLSHRALADDNSVIEYREHIMNTLNEQAAALGEILSGAIPDDAAVAHFEAIALAASIALKAFEPKVPGGEAKPIVWNDWADFSRRMNEFAKETAKAAKLAQQQGKDASLADLVGAFTCKECHDVYRDKKRGK
jgi:cytochrome c556